VTFGHLVAEVVRRVLGRPFDAFFHDEVVGHSASTSTSACRRNTRGRVAPTMPPDFPPAGEVRSRFLERAVEHPESVQGLIVKNTGQNPAPRDRDSSAAHRAVVPSAWASALLSEAKAAWRVRHAAGASWRTRHEPASHCLPGRSAAPGGEFASSPRVGGPTPDAQQVPCSGTSQGGITNARGHAPFPGWAACRPSSCNTDGSNDLSTTGAGVVMGFIAEKTDHMS
jgi:hypothetical protein